MPASRGSPCASTRRARPSSSLPGPSSPVLPLYIPSDLIWAENSKGGVKVYRKLSKNALHYGVGPCTGTAQFSADLVRKSQSIPYYRDTCGNSIRNHTKPGACQPPALPPPPCHPAAASQLGNSYHVAFSPPARLAASKTRPPSTGEYSPHLLPGRNPLQGSPPSARHCRFP